MLARGAQTFSAGSDTLASASLAISIFALWAAKSTLGNLIASCAFEGRDQELSQKLLSRQHFNPVLNQFHYLFGDFLNLLLVDLPADIFEALQKVFVNGGRDIKFNGGIPTHLFGLIKFILFQPKG